MDRSTATALSLTVLLVAVPLGGCLGVGGGGSPTADPTTDATDTTTDPPTTDTATTQVRGGYLSIAVDVERVTTADLVDAFTRTPAEFGPERRPVVGQVLTRSNHTVDTRHVGHPGHVDDGELLVGEDRYYRVERTVTDRSNATVHLFELSTVGDPNESVQSAALALGDLSAIDRSLVRDGLPTDERTDEAAPFTAEYRHAFANGTVPDASTLADGDAHYLRVGGSYYRLRMTGTQRTTRYRIRYEATVAFESRAALSDALVDRHVGTVSTLPNGSGQRKLLLRALDGERVRWETDDGADPPADFRALRDLFEEYATGSDGLYLRHDGTLYRVDLRIAVS